MSNTTAARLAAKCQRDEVTGCLNFTGYAMKSGHGQLWCSKSKKLTLAYRIAWELVKGPIPAGMFVCHHCDNGRCCEISHLFLGTQADNMADMRAKGRGSKPPTHYGPLNPTTRAAIGAKSKAKWADADYRAARLAEIRTRWNDPEYKTTAGLIVQWFDPERRAAMAAQSKARWANPEYRAARAAELKARWVDPIWRAELLAARKAGRKKRSPAVGDAT